MSTTKREYQAGDVLVIRRQDWNGGVLAVNIDRVTKKQLIVIRPGGEGMKDIIRFEKERYWNCGEEPLRHEEVGNNHARSFWSWYAYDWSEELGEDKNKTTIDVLNEMKAAEEERQRQKREAEEERQRKIDERNAAEMAEFREAYGGPKAMSFVQPVLLKDGSRLYTVHLPVNSESAERKGGFEVIVVRCKDVEEYDFEAGRRWLEKNGYDRRSELTDDLAAEYERNAKVKRVESACTYCNGSTSSFSSVSTSKYDTDEEALWEAGKRRYFDWW